MTHLDPELLALLALERDAATAEERQHLDDCSECRAEVRRFVRAVDAIRLADQPLVEPAPHVWAGIATALRLGPPPTGSGRPSSRRPRRIRRRTAVVAGLVGVALAIGGLGIGLLRAADRPEQVATAVLRAFPDWRGSSGTAVLERLADGREVVRLTARVPVDAAADREVWLMTDGARRLVSLGLLRGTTGTFAVPDGLDVSRFHLVDVSEEPRDGNPAHSGDSIVRGALRS